MRCLLVLLLAVLGMSHAQIKNECPKIQTVENFKLNEFLGTWYEIRRNLLPGENGLRCDSSILSRLNKTTIKFVNKGIKISDGKIVTNVGTATSAGEDMAKLDFLFANETAKTPYYILDTDYKNYAAALACRGPQKKVQYYAWLLTRTRKPNPEHVSKALSAFKAHGVSTETLLVINQERCGNL